MAFRDVGESVAAEFGAFVHTFAAEDILDMGRVGAVRDIEPSPGVVWLRAQGEDWSDHGDRLVRASNEIRERERESKQRYRRTPRARELNKACQKRYRARKAVAS